MLAGWIVATLGAGALFGCGGDDARRGADVDAVRPAQPGEKCDRTWRGPSEDEAAAAATFVNGATVPLGGRLWAAIENLGTDALSHGVEPIAERLVGDRWVRQGFTLNGLPLEFTLLALDIEAESVSQCLEVPIPANWKPGKYRVGFEVTPYDSADPIVDPRSQAHFRVELARSS